MKQDLKLLDEMLTMLIKHYGLVVVSDHYTTVVREGIKSLQEEAKEAMARSELT